MLRKAFSKDSFLPSHVLWRRKEAFSDGISSEEDSWHNIIDKFVDKFITDSEFESNSGNYVHCPPQTKEAYFYRKIFDELFGNEYCNLIPDFWMPNWSDASDPSARELKKLYNASKIEESL